MLSSGSVTAARTTPGRSVAGSSPCPPLGLVLPYMRRAARRAVAVSAMGFFDANMITLVLAYEAFVYVAAQMINASRVRWEEAQQAEDVHGAGAALKDYHSSFGTFLLVNGWIVVFFLLATATIVVASILDIRHDLLPVNRWAAGFWSSILFVLSTLSNRSMGRSYAAETEQMGVTPPFRTTWPRLVVRNSPEK